jgi:hypothetical protein
MPKRRQSWCSLATGKSLAAGLTPKASFGRVKGVAECPWTRKFTESISANPDWSSSIRIFMARYLSSGEGQAHLMDIKKELEALVQ